jgi:rhodanese-related sulfurtransferase
MPTTVKQMMDAANAVVPKITVEEARALVAQGNAVIVDVRDSAEVQQTGMAKGALHIPRGSLEFRADAITSYHDPNLKPDKTVILYCAAGSRAALAGKALKDMGYKDVRNLGGFKDWAEQGGDVEGAPST